MTQLSPDANLFTTMKDTTASDTPSHSFPMNEPNTELVRHEPQPVTPLDSRDPAEAVMQMLESSIKGGITSENVAVTKELMGLFKEMNAIRAEKQFNDALTRVQSAIRASGIKATRQVYNRDKTPRYKYADMNDILEVAGPILDAHGFSVSYDVEYQMPHVFATCELRHRGGHKEKKRYGVRPGDGPPGSSTSQADGSGITYAQRGALRAWLNLQVDRDNDGAGDDAREVGDTITPEVARALQARVRACGADESDFLEFAGAGVLPDTASAEDVVFAYLKIPKARMVEIEKSITFRENNPKVKK